MIIDKIDRMFRGWFIGDFEPSIYKTKGFEVGYLKHKKGESWPSHYHKESIEINYLVKGIMTIQGNLLNSGDLFILEKGEIADPVFHEDCELVVVKVPSLPKDKYLV
jgi:quercetin dioxygenase-like cupin family protein